MNKNCTCKRTQGLIYYDEDKPYDILSLDGKSRKLYSVLLKTKATAKECTALNLEYDIEPQEWKYLYLLPRKVLIDERSREFQYKFLQNYIVTNVNLKRMNIADSDLCTFCQRSAETTKHLFFECDIVRHFWEQFVQWWKEKCHRTICLTASIILYGEKPRKPPILLNQVIIIAKQYIKTE